MGKNCIICGQENEYKRSNTCSMKCKEKHEAILLDQKFSKARERKLCKLCNKTKKYSEYRLVYKKGVRETRTTRGWYANDKSIRYSWCRDCEIIIASKRYRKNPYSQIYYNTKKRAKEKNFKFDLDKDFIKDLYDNAPKYCPVLGIEMRYAEIGTKKNQSDNSPSIDRIDPRKGYTKDNVIIMSNLANRIKTDATKEQIEKVWKFLKNNT